MRYINLPHATSLITPRPRAITLVHVSNFRPVKRIEDLIYSMCIITKKEPNAQLILVGDGPERHKIERLIDKLDLRRNIIITGYRSDVAAMMNCADVWCSAARQKTPHSPSSKE